MALYSATKEFTIKQNDQKHYITIDALYGSVQSSTFFNIEGKKITVNNQNNDGYLGKGSDLKGKSLIIRTQGSPDIDDRGVDRIGIEYFVDDQSDLEPIYSYDKEEEEDPYPYVRLKIDFT